MSRFLSPHKTSAHRIAAVALYRALLTQCRAAPLPVAEKGQLENLIRYRFHKQRSCHSIKRLRVAFCGAYEGLDKLDAAIAGDDASTSYILDLLARAPQEAVEAPLRPVQACTKTIRREQDGRRRSILDRPRPLHELSGRRHVPRLVSAGSLPMLRIKKPQPRSLSGYIARRLKRQSRRTDLKHKLTAQLETTAAEDEWDQIIADEIPEAEQTTFESSATHESSWTAEVARSRHSVLHHMGVVRGRDIRIAEQMQRVVDAERTQSRIERAERQRTRREENRRERDRIAEVDTGRSDLVKQWPETQD